MRSAARAPSTAERQRELRATRRSVGEQVLAEERRDPAVHLGQRRAVEAGRVVHQLGGKAGPPGRKWRQQRAVTSVRKISEPLARGACLEHAVAVEARYQ